MKQSIFLGVDLGTSSVKVVVLSTDGQVLASAQEQYPMSRPSADWAEQNPEDWWRATCQAIRQALAGDDFEVRAVGLSGQMHGLVLTDHAGSPVRPAIVWSDARSVDQVSEWSHQIDPSEVERIAGLPIATGMLGLSLTWVRDTEPGAYRAARYAMLPKDYLRYRLTGFMGTEPSDAGGSLLFDVRQGIPAERIAQAVGLDIGMFPPLGVSLEVAGGVTSEASQATGLPERTPVAYGGGDQAMAALALGLEDPSRAAIAISSGGTVFKRTMQPLDAARGLHVLRAAPAGQWLAMGVVLAAGLAVDWLSRQFIGATPSSQELFQLMEEAHAVPKGSEGLIVSAQLGGTRTPVVDPLVRGHFFGLGLGHTRAHMTRALVEGTCLALTGSLESMRAAGEGASELVLSGGGARFDVWRQTLADVSGMPVQLSSDLEHSAIGAGLAAAAAVGEDIQFNARARVSEIVEPDMDAHAMYQEISERLHAAETAVNGLINAATATTSGLISEVAQ